MTNHGHLLVGMPKANLSRGMSCGASSATTRGEAADALGYGRGSAVTMPDPRVRGSKRVLNEAHALTWAISPAFDDANEA